MTYYDWELASPYEGATCPKCGCGLEVDHEAKRVFCPECESHEAKPFYERTAMSDKMRWRYGDTNPVKAAVDSSTAIEIGDLLFQAPSLEGDMHRKVAYPASEIGQMDAAEQMQKSFAEVFLGVAMQRSRSGDTDSIRLAATGVFEFDCPSGTFELGDQVGPAVENIGADNARLENQVVVPVASSQYAIGRVANRVPSPATSVLVDVRSTVMTGGVQGSSRPR